MYLNLNSLYFNNESHKQLFLSFYNQIGCKEDIDYITFCYVAAAAGKKAIIKHLTTGGIKGDEIIEMIQVYSSGEKLLIYMALHLFNSCFEQPKLDNLFYSLDEDLKKVVVLALVIKYNINI